MSVFFVPFRKIFEKVISNDEVWQTGLNCLKGVW